MYISKERRVWTLDGDKVFIKNVFIAFRRENPAVAAFEELLAIKSDSDIHSGTVYVITTLDDQSGFYVYVDDNAMLCGVSISNDKQLYHINRSIIEYFNRDSNPDCYIPFNSLNRKSPTRRVTPLFSLSLPNDEPILEATIKALHIKDDGKYKYPDEETPVYVDCQSKRIIFKC